MTPATPTPAQWDILASELASAEAAQEAFPLAQANRALADALRAVLALREAEQAETGERPEIRVGDVLADHISVFRIDNAEEAEFWQEHTDTLTALYRDPLWRQEPPTHD